jgi:hypothetical protein
VQGLVRTARSLVKTAAPCGAGGSTPAGGPGRCFRIREEGQNSALAPDVPIGMAFAQHCHVRFLFWLCKRTAVPNERLGFYPVNCHLDGSSQRTGACPNYAKFRASVPMSDPEHVTRPERPLNSQQQRPGQANVSCHGRLFEPLPVGINALDLDGQVHKSPWFAPTFCCCRCVSFRCSSRHVSFHHSTTGINAVIEHHM